MAQLIGLARIGRDAELRTTQDGTAVASLSLAMDYRTGREKAVQWVEGALWGKPAEALAQYLVKGKLVFVVLDDVHIEEFQRRDGTAGTRLVGRVSKIELAGGGERAEERAAPKPAPKPAAAATGFSDMDDDIPFILSLNEYEVAPPKMRRLRRARF
jgi:single-strand DNA-binding protein